MERVLLKNKNGYMITAYFKDGMLQCDGDKDWTHPIAWDSFIRLKDLANGVPTRDSGLHLQRVSEAKRKLPMAIVVRRNAKLMDYESFVSWYNKAIGNSH